MYLKMDQQKVSSRDASTSTVGAMTSTRSIMPLSQTPEMCHNTSDQNMAAAKEEFVAILGRDGVNDKIGDLVAHSSTPWSEAPSPSDHAAIIVFPSTTQEVSNIVKICNRRRIPMTPFSGGTSLEGALAATRGGVCIDFNRMEKIIAVHKRDMDAVVQPGVGWQLLNEELEKDDLFFPIDPGPGACIGGMVATGCSGTNAYRYGTMKDWVISLTVVLADGTIIKTRGRPRKSSAGYDLTRMFVGASGTLGIVTEAVVKITSKPKNLCVAVAAFPSIQSAVNAAVMLVQQEVPVAALEMLDETFMRSINQQGSTDRTWKETPTIFFKFSGSTVTAVQEQIALVQKFSKQAGSLSFDIGKTEEEVDSLWDARKTCLWSFLATKEHPDDQFVSSDVAVPISRLADIMEETKSKIKRSGLQGSVLAHAGDGNFHAAILYSAENKEKAERIIAEIQEVGIRFEGTVSGEHGIGLTFRDALEAELGPDTVATMRQIKLALDPLCLLNPDKVFKLQAD
jgi:D-lactate dehydrogenase (cytochrome)